MKLNMAERTAIKEALERDLDSIREELADPEAPNKDVTEGHLEFYTALLAKFTKTWEPKADV